MILNRNSLKWRSIKGAVVTSGGFALSQILRFGSNLILTRLLIPEYFGMMALVNVLLIGLNMFSDIGIGPNIVQSDKSIDEDFLNTAWTLQIVRGCGIWVASLIICIPFSMFYNEEKLKYLIPAASLVVIVNGFISTKIFTNNKELKMFRITLIEIGSQVISILTMIGLATIIPSVWIFIIGSLIGAITKMLVSHLYLPGINNKLCWNREILKELVHFGKWIFFSTVLSFANNSMGSLIMGKLVPMAEVGVFSIASTLSKTAENVYNKISQTILFPLYNNIKNESPKDIKRKVKKIRILVIATFLPALLILYLFGEEIITLLFDDRYMDAGWILSILSLGIIPIVITALGPFYLALGNSRLQMFDSLVKFLSYILCIFIGYQFFQTDGVIYGIAFYSIFVYIFGVFIQINYKIWIPIIDVIAFSFTAFVIFLDYII